MREQSQTRSGTVDTDVNLQSASTSWKAWAMEVPGYLWLVLIAAFLGWMFDAMDLNVLTLVLTPAIRDLTGASSVANIAHFGGITVAVKLFAWGLGGALFGIVTDRLGRVRTMIFTILIYAVFTGLSAVATSWPELLIFQAIAGIGIGGEWAAGAALVAETWPEHLRPRAIQIMQMAFSFGFFAAALDNLLLGPSGWRWVFAAGAIPALLTLLPRKFLREPERWLAVHVSSVRSRITIARIFEPDLRKITIAATLIGIAMMVGCWGGLTWIPSWTAQLLSPDQLAHPSTYVSYVLMLMNGGAILGYVTLMWLTEAVGRRWSYFIFCAGSLVSSFCLFAVIHSYIGLCIFMPIYGYFAIGGFGTFAVYLPELFPTIVRATGQGFCWNIARFFTGFGPLIGGVLVVSLGSFTAAIAVIALVFILGLVAIWFLPETRGVPLRDY